MACPVFAPGISSRENGRFGGTIGGVNIPGNRDQTVRVKYLAGKIRRDFFQEDHRRRRLGAVSWAACFRGRFVGGGGAPETAQAEAPPTRADTTTGTAPRAAPADDPRQGRRAASSGTGGAGRGGRRPPGAGPDAGRRPRLAGSPRRGVLRARYQAYTQSINGPPYNPPTVHARGSHHSCKIHSHSPP